MGNGWIALDRSIIDHWIFNNVREHNDVSAWILLLLLVNHSDQKVRLGNTVHLVKRGQSIRSIKSWSKLFNWSEGKTRRWFKMCREDGMIIDEQVAGKSTRITVCNYERYQDLRRAGDEHIDEQVTNSRRTGDEQVTTNNNDNNDNNEEQKDRVGFEALIFPFGSDDFLSKWQDWKDYKLRKKKFKYKNLKAEQSALTKLKNLSNDNEADAIQIIDKAIENKWVGFFSLNGDEKTSEEYTEAEFKLMSIFFEATGKKITFLPAKARRQFKKLREEHKYVAEDFEKVITNCATNEWIMEHPDVMTVEYITREETFQKYLHANDVEAVKKETTAERRSRMWNESETKFIITDD